MDLGDTLLWWVAGGRRCDQPHRQGGRGNRVDGERGHHRILERREELSRLFRRLQLLADRTQRLSRQGCRDVGGRLRQGRRLQAGARATSPRPAAPDACFHPGFGPCRGRDLRAHRRDLQHHVRDLAGHELHRRTARHARRRVRVAVRPAARNADDRRARGDARRLRAHRRSHRDRRRATRCSRASSSTSTCSPR